MGWGRKEAEKKDKCPRFKSESPLEKKEGMDGGVGTRASFANSRVHGPKRGREATLVCKGASLKKAPHLDTGGGGKEWLSGTSKILQNNMILGRKDVPLSRGKGGVVVRGGRTGRSPHKNQHHKRTGGGGEPTPTKIDPQRGGKMGGEVWLYQEGRWHSQS